MNKHITTPNPQSGIEHIETFSFITSELATKGWAVVDNFLSFEWASELQEEHRVQLQRGNFSLAGTGRNNDYRLDSTTRGDWILWLDQENSMSAQYQYLLLLEQLRLAVNRDLLLGLYGLEAHAAIYSPGTFYQRHLDSFQRSNLRTLTTILYLNPRWRHKDGGALRFYMDEEPEGHYIDILPESGRLVIFLSDCYHHEVLTTHRERSSITGWFSRRSMNQSFSFSS